MEDATIYELERKNRRAQRRQDKKRIGKKVFKKYHNSDGSREYFDTYPSEKERLEGIYSQTKVPCSCGGCGNPRRNDWATNADKLTIQERKDLWRCRDYDPDEGVYHDSMIGDETCEEMDAISWAKAQGIMK